MISAAELAHVISHCPCGAAYDLVEYRQKNAPSIWRALYYDAKHDRDFCSAACSAKWYERFVSLYEEHKKVR